MKLPFTLGITRKLTVIFVVFAGVLLTGLGALAYKSGSESLQTATISDLQSTATEKEAALNDWSNDKIRRISLDANLVLIRQISAELVTLDPQSPAAQQARDTILPGLKTRTGPSGEFAAMFALDARDGHLLVANDPREEGEFKEDPLYFVKGKQDAVLEIYYSVTLASPAVTAAAPLLSPDGRLVGVLVGRVDINELDQIIRRRSGDHQTDDVYLLNNSGLLVTRPRFMPEASILQKSAQSDLDKLCLTRKNGVVAANDYRGIPVIAVYHWLPERDACLIVKVDREEALAPVNAFGQTIFLTNGLALLVATVIAALLARTISQPILRLKEVVAGFGAGNLDARLSETPRDEIGLLAREFNRMATALVEKETQLRERAAQLETANQELEAFSYSVSHDLRAPLRAIDGFSRILLEDHSSQLTEDAKRYLNLVRNNTQQMGNLVDDLLTFSRLSRQPLKKQTVSQNALVRQVLDDLRAEQAGRKIEIALEDLPSCQADPALLKQVWVNLLANALKFTRQREIARIEIGFRKEDSANIYFVKDNGVGFEARYADKLFGVFQRLHRTEEYEGTGVGLAIVERIVHRHGGRVWAESELDKGATFFFMLESGMGGTNG